MTNFDLAQTDRLMQTTKQVRKRLDLTRTVPVNTVLDCIDIASRAPIGGNMQVNRWLLIDDAKKIQALASLYGEYGKDYLENGKKQVEQLGSDPTAKRVVESSIYLLEHLKDVPLMIIPLRIGLPGKSLFEQATFFGSVLPGVWSLQMALRSRGIGSAWTTLHLYNDLKANDLLGIPDTVTQVALLPTAYYTGSDFIPSKRRDAKEITYHNTWKDPVS